MSVNTMKKMCNILMILVDFCGNFPRFWLIFAIRIRFIEADPADQNETDPNGSGSETLLKTVSTKVEIQSSLENLGIYISESLLNLEQAVTRFNSIEFQIYIPRFPEKPCSYQADKSL